MSERLKDLIQFLIAALVGAALVIYADHRFRIRTPETITVTVTDTLVVRDTVTVEKPVYKTSRIVDTITVLLPVEQCDTIVVRLPREERVYEDSTYRAVVSGYEPSLDRIDIFGKYTFIYTTQVETVTKVKRWNVTAGPQLGVGITPEGWRPYAGIGATFGYSF